MSKTIESFVGNLHFNHRYQSDIKVDSYCTFSVICSIARQLCAFRFGKKEF